MKKSLLIGSLVLLYTFTRLYALLNLPMFVDEATYLYWTTNNMGTSAFRDGKLLSMELWRLFLLLPFEPLVSFRLLTVISGLIALLALVWTGATLLSFTAGWIGGLVFILLPFNLFFNRLATSDSVQLMFGALVLALSIRMTLRQSQKLDTVWLASVLVAGVLVKASGFLFLAIPPLAAILLVPADERKRSLTSVLPGTLLASVAAVALFAAGFSRVQTGQFQGLGLREFPENVGAIINWLWILITPVGCLVLLASAFSHRKAVWFLMLAFLISPAFYSISSRTIYSRYILFSLIPASLLIGHLIADWLAAPRTRRATGVAVASLLLAALTIPDVTILTHPQDTTLPARDRWQYVDNWPSGYGYAEMTEYLNQQIGTTTTRKTLVIAHETWSYPTLGVWYVFRNRSDIEIIPTSPEAIDQGLPLTDFWVIVDRNRDDVRPPGMTRVWMHKRSDTDNGLEIWH